MASVGIPPSAEGEARFPELEPDEIIRVAERILDDLGWHIESVERDLIRVRTGTGIWFFGDRMTVEVSRKGSVRVKSQCIWPTMLFDFGRNDQNVDRFLARLGRKLLRRIARDDERLQRGADDDRQ